jgi:zinc transport system substrate-binding protein
MIHYNIHRLPAMASGAFLVLWMSLCTAVPTVCATAPVQVVVSILPQKYFVERIGGRRVTVSALVGPGQSPATYEPSPRQMLTLARAQIYFRIGVPIEAALIPRIRQMYPKLRISDTREGVQLRLMDTSAEIFGDSHKPAHHHTEARDPHIWLSPALVKIQAHNIARTLSAADPAGADYYRTQAQLFTGELAELEQELTGALSHLSGRRILVFHPAWGYFADQFQLQQLPVEISGKEPSPRQLARIIEFAKRENIRVMFVQSQFSGSGARAIMDAMDGVVVSLDPLGESYPDNLRRIANTVAQHFLEP